MSNTDDAHGNFDKCPLCGHLITNLHRHYDSFEAWTGKNDLECVNDMTCQNCNREIALVTDFTHRLKRLGDAR